jgi:hypothetical protein
LRHGQNRQTNRVETDGIILQASNEPRRLRNPVASQAADYAVKIYPQAMANPGRHKPPIFYPNLSCFESGGLPLALAGGLKIFSQNNCSLD